MWLNFQTSMHICQPISHLFRHHQYLTGWDLVTLHSCQMCRGCYLRPWKTTQVKTLRTITFLNKQHILIICFRFSTDTLSTIITFKSLSDPLNSFGKKKALKEFNWTVPVQRECVCLQLDCPVQRECVCLQLDCPVQRECVCLQLDCPVQRECVCLQLDCSSTEGVCLFTAGLSSTEGVCLFTAGLSSTEGVCLFTAGLSSTEGVC